MRFLHRSGSDDLALYGVATMTYTIRTTGTESGKGYRHEFLRNGKLTSYAEYGPTPEPPLRMRRWLNKLNRNKMETPNEHPHTDVDLVRRVDNALLPRRRVVRDRR